MSATLEVGDVDAWLTAADAAFEARLLAAQSQLTGVALSTADGVGQLGVGGLRLDPFTITVDDVGRAHQLAVLVCSPRGESGWDPAGGDADALRDALAAHVHPTFATAELRCGPAS